MMLEIWCDGGARPNPGNGGIGFVVKRNGKIIMDGYQYLGDKITNNQAEFSSIVNALSVVFSELKDRQIIVYMDSRLVVMSSPSRELSRRFVIRDKKLKVFVNLLEKLISKFESVVIEKISREENKLADKLCHIAIDTKHTRVMQYEP